MTQKYDVKSFRIAIPEADLAEMSHCLPSHPDQPAGVKFDPVPGLPAETEYTAAEAGWFDRGPALCAKRKRLRRDAADQAAGICSPCDGLSGRPVQLDHREAAFLGSGITRRRDCGVRPSLAQGRPDHHCGGLFPDANRRHLVALLLGPPRQSQDTQSRPLPGGGRADRRLDLPRRNLQAADALDRDVLQPEAIPHPQRGRPLCAAGGARSVCRRPSQVFPSLPGMTDNRSRP